MNQNKNKERDTSESFFRNLLEMAPDAMIIVDRKGSIVVVNSQVERMFGYLRDELYGQAVEILLPDKARDVHRKHRAAYTADPHVRPMGRNMELAGRRRDGSEFPVEISLSPVKTSSGNFISSVVRDVTEQKRLERELIEARHSAERANKANTAFLAAASHDLRQPVQALSLLNGALRRTVSNANALEMIDSQQQSLDAMTNLLNSLLDISRLDAGAVKPDIEKFPIRRVVDRLSSEFSRQASQKGLDFSAVSSPIVVESDPNLLSEIIQNFVSNAIRYTSKGGVEMRCEKMDDHICVRVRDSGAGIAPEHLEEIFAEFQQIRTPGQKSEGFGLGLAIVQRLSDLLGHRIEVESEPGKGSEFSICVPIVGDGIADTAEPDEVLESDNVERVGMIVLIEDDSAVANALTSLFETEGYRVAVAASAIEAQAIATHLGHAPDLIVSDFHLLDGSTGVAAVESVRNAFSKDIPAFIVTGDTSLVVSATRDLPNSLLIRKPVNPDSLLNDAHAAVETGRVPVFKQPE